MRYRLSIKILFWFSLFIIAIVVVNLASIYQLQRMEKPLKEELTQDIQNIKENEILDHLAELIRYYDEVLTQSVRNYAFTGNLEWKKRYQNIEPKLDQAIKEAISRGNRQDKKFFKTVDQANEILVNLEHQALDLVDQGNQDQAIAILESKKYRANKNQYYSGFSSYLQRRMSEHEKAITFSSKDLEETISILNEITKQNYYFFIASLAFILLVSFLFGLFLRFNVSQPLTRLVKLIKASGKKGGRKDLVNNNFGLMKRKDEIGELATTYNQIWQDLEETTVSREKLVKEVELHKESKQKISRLNMILRSISEINQMLINVDNRKSLIEKTCRELINIRGYKSAWIVLFDPQGDFLDAASFGLGDKFNLFKNDIKVGSIPRCLSKICKEKKLFQVDEPHQMCKDCSLYKYHQGVKTIVTCLQLEGVVYGALTVAIPESIEIDQQELSLLKEISGDISLGLHHLEVEKKRRLTENKLKERVKEFGCLSNLAKIVEEPGISLEGILAKTVEIIPFALQYPSSASARLRYAENEYNTKGFKETNCKLKEDIYVDLKKVGFIEACYSLSIQDEKGECPFLEEENTLFRLIAERLGRIIERKKAEEFLEEAKNKFSSLVDNVPGAIYRCANDSKWTMNYISDEIEKISGYPASDFIKNKVRTYESIIYKEDKDLVNKKIQEAIEKGKSYNIEYRIVNKNDKVVWVGEKGKGVFNKEEKLIWLDGVIFDITLQKKAEDKLEKAIKMKSDFLSTVSHELRTPLAAIKEGINIVYDQSAGKINKEQKEFLTISKRNVDRLARLINDVLDIQKLESGKAEFNFKKENINDIIKEVFETMQPHAAKKQLQLKLNLDSNISKIKVDRDKIIQVITNLMSNAIKFTEQGKVVIKSLLEQNAIKVIVSDTGPGIKKEDLSKLFKTFQQLQTGKGRKTGGTGLGLAICKDIINKHRGKIWAESELDKGSKFIFLLPIKERRA
ncbi:MAG: PAS domain-containing protein [Candidatus Omnitrophica bacterium]|nr:PAS domain-containing protein [Candidatus Omnitrophota bacterium]MCF7894279.1 PAS domain-containing protein [Candidatus Omnitrophota bacterium]